MAVADGATPSSEGRGYVLRRILRRAVRYGRSKLDAPPGFFSKLVPKVVESLSPGFPDLTKAAGERVQGILQDEEVAFDRTVDRGMQFFDGLKADLEKEGAKVVPGDQAFLLYDSHGFPLDLTEQMALESGLSVDIAGFEAAMEQQKERSRAALREQQAQEQGLRPLQLVAEQTAWLSDEKIPVTDDLKKYTWNIRPSARVEAIYTEQGFVDSSAEIKDQSASVGIVLNTSPFYAEAGGQVGDLGLLTNEDGEELMKVKVVQVFAGYVLHVGPMPVTCAVGDEVFCEAIYGLRAMAGEAYPDPVRVVTVGSPIEEVLQSPGAEKWRAQSVEFCGGTHIATTSEAKHFVLLEEKGIAKGVRRIFAATGAMAETALEEAQRVEKRMNELESSSVEEDALMALQKDLDSLVLPAVPKSQLRDRLGELRKQLKKKQKKKKKDKVSKEEQAAALTELKEAVAEAKSLGKNFCVKTFQGAGVDGKSLREAAQGGEFDIAVMVLNQPSPKALECLAAVPEALQSEKAAGKWVQAALATVGGKGGGQAAFAQGAAKGVEEEALQVAAEAARNF